MRSFILAARPKTLPAAVVPVWAGCVLSYGLTNTWSLSLAVYTLLGAVIIQIATNFFNDAIDAEKGADTAARLGPVRATASGQLSKKSVYLAAVAALAVAAVFGALLIQARGWPILAIGLPSLYFAYGYTGGPWPLAYKGLGELFVILFFGIVAVMGTVFIQTGEWWYQSFLLGLAIGCLSSALITINNLRDKDEDRGNGKNTLAVKWGRAKVLLLLTVMVALPYAILPVLLETSWRLLMFFPAYLLGVIILMKVRSTPPSPAYNNFLALSALHLVLYALALHLYIVT